MDIPQIEAEKAKEDLELYLNEPMIGGDPVRRRELFNRVMVARRTEGREDLLPSKEEVLGEQKKAMEAEIREKVIAELIQKGIIPPPPPPPGLPGMPPQGPGIPAPAAAPGLPVGPPMPGAPPGAVGLPPVNNLPPTVGV